MIRATERILVEGIFRDPFYTDEERGELCFSETSFYVRAPIHLSISLLNVIILRVLYSQKNQSLSSACTKKPHIHNIERSLGIVCALTLVLQIIYKIRSQSLIFILNPCHSAVFILTYLLFSPYKHYFMFNYLVSLLLGSLLGLNFPATDSLKGFGEVELFYMEHCLPLIGVITLASLHYKEDSLLKMSWHQIGLSVFSLYHRLILWPISELYKVNLNFVICGNSSDPFHKLLASGYLIAGEFYLSLGSYVVRYATLKPVFSILTYKKLLKQ